MQIKTFLILSIFMCFGGLLIAQDNTFNWGFNVYPNYSGRRLVALANYDREQIREIEDLETGMFAYSAGIMAEWKAQKLGMRLGLSYLSSGYQTIKVFLQNDDPNSPSEEQIQYRSNFIEVPVEFLFSHDLIDTKASVFFMLGASLSYNLGNNTRTIGFFRDTQTSASEPSEGDFRNINYAFQSGIGLELSVGERLILLFQPNFQFWLQGLTTDTDLNRNLYSVGLKTGILF